MSKETIEALASKANVATAGSTTTMAFFVFLGWQTLGDIQRKLDTQSAQMTIMVQKLEQRIELIERRLGEIYVTPRMETGKARP